MTLLVDPARLSEPSYRRALAEATSLSERRNAPRPDDPRYAWQRGLDMEESRRLAESINQAARRDEARREAARAKPPAVLRASVSVDGNRIIVDAEANTGAANEAWRALRAAKIHIWDTQGPRIIIVGRDRVEQVRAKTIEVLRAAGLVVDAESPSSTHEVRNAGAKRRGSLPRYDERKGLWRGGDPGTLYAFTSLQTGRTWLAPGGTKMYCGPEATVRVATRDEAEALWQRPLHPGWQVVGEDRPRNAAVEQSHIAILRRVANEQFATIQRGVVVSTSSTVQGAMASAPSAGGVMVRGEYTSDGTHWGLSRGRLVASRENGRWALG